MVQAQNHPWMLEHVATPVATVPESILVAMRDWGSEYLSKKNVKPCCFMIGSDPVHTPTPQKGTL